MDAHGTEAPHQVHGEEREPTQDEHSHDDPQSLGRLRLHPEPLHLDLDVPSSHPRRAGAAASHRAGRAHVLVLAPVPPRL